MRHRLCMYLWNTLWAGILLSLVITNSSIFLKNWGVEMLWSLYVLLKTHFTELLPHAEIVEFCLVKQSRRFGLLEMDKIRTGKHSDSLSSTLIFIPFKKHVRNICCRLRKNTFNLLPLNNQILSIFSIYVKILLSKFLYWSVCSNN